LDARWRINFYERVLRPCESKRLCAKKKGTDCLWEEYFSDMTIAQTDEPIPQKPLRLWPGVVIVILQWLIRFVVPIVVPGAILFAVLGGLFGGLAIAVWWVFLSRAPWSERLGAIIVMIAALFATSHILHESIARGAQGLLFIILAIPVLSLAFVAWAVAGRRLSDGPRRAAMVATILLASGGWALVRTGGMTGNFDNDLKWRWAKTPEERLLAQAADEQAARPATPAVLPAAPAGADTGADWPGFRGPHRDGIIPGVWIETDWSAAPPVELWRRPIGPGWSSFAVHGDLLYTQEQRGGDEVVACYNVTTGEPVWKHRDAARFWESNGGAGPRATPTLSNGRVYTFGATGILNVLDARDGAVVWSRNAASDTETKVPGWGFASSPLVVDDVVIVPAEGRLASYDFATGNPRWVGPDGGAGYSSPHLLTIGRIRELKSYPRRLCM
jgi:outer membrane protein assembly factor BamB